MNRLGQEVSKNHSLLLITEVAESKRNSARSSHLANNTCCFFL